MLLPIWPSMALRRYSARQAFEGACALAAADKGRGSSGSRKVRGNVKDHYRAGRREIAEKARYLVTSSSVGRAAVQSLQDATIGTGIRAQDKSQYLPSLQTDEQKQRNEELRTKANDARKRWNENCDYEGSAQYEDFENLAFSELMTDGNAMFREMVDPDFRSKGLAIPLQYQALNACQLTAYRTQPEKPNEVVDGLELDARNRVVAYHFVDNGYRHKVIRVAASEIVHAYRLDVPGQKLGLSWLSAVIPEMQQYEQIKHAALIAQKVQASIALIISRDKSGDMAPIVGLNGQAPATDDNGVPLRAIEPGMMHDIGTGKVHSHNPTPSNNLEILTKLLHRSIGVGCGSSYEWISNDYSNVNFAGGRLSVLQTRKHVSGVHDFFCRRFESPIDRAFRDFSREFDRDYPRFARGTDPYAVAFSLPKFEWGVNPLQEVKAQILAIAHGLSSLETEVGSMGGDATANLLKIVDEVVKELGHDLPAPVHPVLKSAPDTANNEETTNGMDA